MTKKQNNNFADPATKSKVRYRLLIIHNRTGIEAGHLRKFGYNGYVTHQDLGYENLLKMMREREGMIIHAELFDFIISKKYPVQKWDFDTKKIKSKKNYKSKRVAEVKKIPTVSAATNINLK